MKKEIYNAMLIESIKVFDKKQTPYLEHKPFKKSIFGNQEEGFYFTISLLGSRVFSKEDLERGEYANIQFIVEDNKAYYRPHVTITFPSGDKHDKSFPDYEGALKYAEDKARKINSKIVYE